MHLPIYKCPLIQRSIRLKKLPLAFLDVIYVGSDVFATVWPAEGSFAMHCTIDPLTFVLPPVFPAKGASSMYLVRAELSFVDITVDHHKPPAAFFQIRNELTFVLCAIG
jgi:hypothetical protein